jgi:hypothetical protein
MTAVIQERNFAISPRIAREFCWEIPYPLNQRAQEMPGADAPAAARVV